MFADPGQKTNVASQRADVATRLEAAVAAWPSRDSPPLT